MLRHPAPGALMFMIYQETHTATINDLRIKMLHPTIAYALCLTIAGLALS